MFGGLYCIQLLWCGGEVCAGAGYDDVFDADAEVAFEVDARFDGDYFVAVEDVI